MTHSSTRPNSSGQATSDYRAGGSPAGRPTRPLIDARGPRFGAAVTTVVLAVAILIGPGSPITLALLIAQTLAFGLGSVAGLTYQPYGAFFRTFVAPRLGPTRHREDPAPPRFAQAIGLGFGAVALIGLATGLDAVFFVAAGMALAAAFLNAAFNFCLGCEMYLLGLRLIRRSRPEAA